MHSLLNSYRKFEQYPYPEPSPGYFQPFALWRNGSAAANVPAVAADFSPQWPYQSVANKQPSAYPQQAAPQYQSEQWAPAYNPWNFQAQPVQMQPESLRRSFPVRAKVKSSPTVWEEFKRIYITEVINFTMSKSTLFTLIFSFMFLGCVFFLSGFFTATNIYRDNSLVHHEKKTHTPTDTALMQGRPEKIVNMGAGIAYATPRAYHSQGGVKIDNNVRRPSNYVEGQISRGQAYYR